MVRCTALTFIIITALLFLRLTTVNNQPLPISEDEIREETHDLFLGGNTTLPVPPKGTQTRVSPRNEVGNVTPPAEVVPPTQTPAKTSVPDNRQLSLSEFLEVLDTAGWPQELWPEAASVACGYGNTVWRWGESNCNPRSTNGCCSGLFQIHRGNAAYCGLQPAELLDPYKNATCALKWYRWDISVGHEPWTQWEVKPAGVLESLRSD